MARSFADILRDLDGGQTYEALGLGMVDAVQAVVATGKSATITLTLNIAANGPGSVTIADTVKTKLPEAPKAKTMFFATESGNIDRNDPRREGITLRTVDDPRTNTEAPREIEARSSNLREVG